MTTTFALLACVFALAIIHPYTFYPLSLRAIRRARGPVRLQATQPAPTRFAIVCCAYNEMSVIERKVANALAVREVLGNCDILFYSDGSDDGTSEYLRACAAPVQAAIGEKQVGKTAGMNLLLSMTDADIVIFTDANVMTDPASAANLARYFQDPGVGMVTGRLHFLNGDVSMTAEVSTTYRGFEEMIKRLETDTGSVVYTDGTMFAMRRTLFTPVPPNLTDDLYTAILVLVKGVRNIAVPDFVAYEHAATVRNDELRRRIRIGCHVFNCHLLLWPQIRELDRLTLYKYVSHKLIRWFAGYFLVGFALAFTALVASLFGLGATFGIVALGAILCLLAGRFRIPVISSAYEAVLVALAVAYGVNLAMRGEQFRTWVIAPSSRDWQKAPSSETPT